MKYLKRFENYLITEIGEATVPPYEIDDYFGSPVPGNTYGHNYIFKTESGLKYSINIMEGMNTFHLNESDVEKCEIVDDSPEDFYNKLIGVSYFTFTGEDNEDIYSTYDDTIITNRGEMYRIMSTLKEVLLKYLDEHPNIKYIFIGGQDGEKEKSKEQRDRLYLAYFNKIRPNWESDKIFCAMRNEWYYIIKINN